MYCLIHIRAAALIVAILGGTVFVFFFLGTGVPTFMAMAVNAALVIAAAATIILLQSRDFTRMVDARTEARRRHQEQSRLLRMIDDMPVAVMTVDPATFDINYVNKTSRRMLDRIEHLLPIRASQVLGSSIDVFHRDPEHQRALLADPANLPHHARIELGPEKLDLQVSAVHADDGAYLGPMLSWAIVTKEVEAENHIRRLAHHDVLTGLPNRITFRQGLEDCLAAPDAPFSLLLIDLDGFKLVNDTRGHHVGDLVLEQVGGRLSGACDGHGAVVARLGGDEFAIILPGGNAHTAVVLADELIRQLSQPYRTQHDRQVRVGASIGVVMAPEHGTGPDLLLARAEIALYAAKAAGKRTFRMFADDMEARMQERVMLEGELHHALERGEGLFVFYQPIVDIRTGRVTSREALVRWFHPRRGWISPAEFVPVAEESGLIEPLDVFVLDQACREAARWDDGASVAVNVSPGQLGKGVYVPRVVAALDAAGLPASRLEIEVTESALLNDGTDAVGDLGRLRDMGVRVALDDFGTGYSSFARLRIFAFDKIKIDGSFVRDALHRADCAAVVRAVAELGQRLGITTVAEGVETEAQRERVIVEGCTEMQGYLCGRPMPGARDAPAIAAFEQNLGSLCGTH
ncbi:MAG: putative bifunctional diguanylate cyclase/phosphodiesterase [Alphaproteobacteria bacterium]